MTEGFTLVKDIWALIHEINYEEVAYNELIHMLQLKKIHEEPIHIIYVLQLFFQWIAQSLKFVTKVIVMFLLGTCYCL